LASAGLFVLSGAAFAAPAKAAKSASKPASSESVRVSGVAHSGSSGAILPADFADAYPSSRPAAPDLLLTKDEEHRADAFAAFSQGIIAEDNADNDAALSSYRKALDLDPSNTQMAAKAASMLLQRDDPSTAIQILKDNIKAAPKEALPLVYLSQIYIKNLKKPDLALKYAEQALALDPTYFPAYAAVFELLAAQNQDAKAEQVLLRAEKSPSTEPEFWLSLGDLYSKVHFREDGTWDVPAAQKEANGIFHKAADLGKADATVQAKVGNYFIETQQVKDAIPFYFKAISLKPNSDDAILTNAKEKLAKALLQTGDRDEAIKILEQVTKENPLSFEQYEFLGQLYEQKGDYDKALENYKHSTLLDSSKPDNHIRLAEMQMRLKHYDDAVDTAKTARARFPDDPQTHYLLAIALSQAKRHTEAMTAFAEAKSEYETDGHEELLNAAFYFAYGAAAEQAGLLDKAVELLKKSIELDPNNSAQAYNYLGYMWVDRGINLDEASAMIKKALDEEPDNGAYLDSSGWLCFKQGDFEGALKQLLKAVDTLKPEDATVYDHLADTYQKLGNVPEALRYWQKALGLHQDDLDPKKVQDKIDTAKQKVTATTPGAGLKAQ